MPDPSCGQEKKRSPSESFPQICGEFSDERFLVQPCFKRWPQRGEFGLAHVDELQVRVLELAQHCHDFLKIITAL
ncbi:hypothetical protein BJ956_003322 [Arthrobacter psychrochitiniphilus]|nr:hypothetical protein [Arthrobacter psychrochitiniphilus]